MVVISDDREEINVYCVYDNTDYVPIPSLVAMSIGRHNFDYVWSAGHVCLPCLDLTL